MARCKTILVNLLLLLGATSCLGWAGRPEFAPAEGCKPGQRTTLECPKVSRETPSLNSLLAFVFAVRKPSAPLLGLGVLYYYRTILFSWFCIPCMTIIDFEICVTWIDLYDRTNKMSKSSSKMTKALRILCRIISLFLTFGFQYVGIASGTILGLFIAAMLPNVCGIVALSIGSPLILKTLCPDKKDVSNPNWKIAEAIRRAVKHGIGSKLIELVALTGMAFTSRNPAIGYTYGVWNFMYWSATMFRMWGWLQYVIYGSRKHLKRYSTAKSSSYFGFSTIGLNKTLTTASSRASSVLSGMSTRSSVAE